MDDVARQRPWPTPYYAAAEDLLRGEGVFFGEDSAGQRTENFVITVLLHQAPFSVNVFGSRTTFHAGCSARTSGTLHFARFNKAAVATFFHVNSSLAAGHNWRQPRLISLEPDFHTTNSLLPRSPMVVR